MRWRGGLNETQGWSLVTDYDTNEVVSGEVFQVQRAASTISSLSNSSEVALFVRESDIFTEQEKNKIIEELVFTNSSQTLLSYGIHLGF